MNVERAGRRITDHVDDLEDVRLACLLAVPDVTTASLARQLTGRSDVDALLAMLASQGLGTRTRDGAGVVLHPAVRRDARNLLRLRWRSDFLDASRATAQWHLERGDFVRAFDYALDSEDIALIGHVGIRVWPSKTFSASYALDRIRALPEDLVRDNAPLSLWLAEQARRSPQAGLRGREHLRAAVTAARRRSSSNATENLLMLGIEALAHSRLGEPSDSASNAHDFANRLRSLSDARRIDESLAEALAAVTAELTAALIFDQSYTLANTLIAVLGAFCAHRELAQQLQRAKNLGILLDACTGHCRRAEAALAELEDEACDDLAELARLLTTICVMDLPGLRRSLQRLDADGGTTGRWEIVLFGTVIRYLVDSDTATARALYTSAIAEHPVTEYDAARRRYLGVIAVTLAMVGLTVPPAAPLAAKKDPLLLSLRAIIALHQGRDEHIKQSITRAMTAASTPLHRHVAAALLSRYSCYSGDRELLRAAAGELRALYEMHGLCAGFMLLSASERTCVLDAVGRPNTLSSAMHRVPLLVRANRLPHDVSLTRREIDVLTALARSGDRRDVADRLFLTPATVKVHLRSIYRKLDVHSESEALQRAALFGIVRTLPR
ncbi:helix-turn-helix transcriptional regulator [Microbacterium sp. gxy059]|uniref:helix-turn-helix transcriptional regulator n=1 Tax=Microbacterium sp. gxy059 TaxID=2957199 RepID=UPI003D96975A